MLYSCIIFIISLYLLFFAYIKVFHRFWSIQPVFHVYNIYYWLIYTGIIESEQLPPTKYYDPYVKTVYFEDVPMDLAPMLKEHFLNEEAIKYSPTKADIEPYFKNNKHSLYSLYYADVVSEQITTEKQLVACITGRKVNVSLSKERLSCYYIDYLCVHKHYRKQGIAQKMIQSHEYNQRKATNNAVSLFKREGHLNLMVPLVAYFTYGFNIHGWKKPVNHVNIVKVSSEMIKHLYDIIGASPFKVKLWMDEHVMLDLLRTDNIYVYALMVDNSIGGLYFLRDSNTQYYKKQTIELFGSINVGVDNRLFVAGFAEVMQKMRETFTFIWIENLSHNQKIIDNIMLKYKYDTICPMAYYFYNYATTPCRENDIIIII